MWPLHCTSAWCDHSTSCQSEVATPPHVGLTWPLHLMSVWRGHSTSCKYDMATPLHVSLDCHIFHHQTSFFGSRLWFQICNPRSDEQLKSFALVKRATVFVVACGVTNFTNCCTVWEEGLKYWNIKLLTMELIKCDISQWRSAVWQDRTEPLHCPASADRSITAG